MSYAMLPTPLEALSYTLPKDFWLRGVGVTEKREGKTYITSLHFINGAGKLVCGCAVHPVGSKVYRVCDFAADERHIYCADSVTYLRRIVKRLRRKGHHG